jgi:hypothetical protein
MPVPPIFMSQVIASLNPMKVAKTLPKKVSSFKDMVRATKRPAEMDGHTLKNRDFYKPPLNKGVPGLSRLRRRPAPSQEEDRGQSLDIEL